MWICFNLFAFILGISGVTRYSTRYVQLSDTKERAVLKQKVYLYVTLCTVSIVTLCTVTALAT